MQKFLAKSDLPTLFHVLVLALVGVLAIYSATHLDMPNFWQGPAGKQLLSVAIGVVLYLVVQRLDYRTVADYATLMYIGACLVLLLLPLLPAQLAPRIGGAKAWFRIAGFSFQPSEPVKVVVALAIAVFLTKIGGTLDFTRLVKLGVLVGIPVGLILMEPDMGTALTFVPLAMAGAWMAGIRLRVLIILGLLVALMAPIAWSYVLKPYQKERILLVFDPTRDPSGSGYQVLQSRIAVGSGGVTGKGLFQGSQSRLNFLPARETDFVLAVIAEETGFVGVIVVLGLYMALVFRALDAALTARDQLGTYLCGGIAALWAGQIFVNTGMVTGILPTIGVPLPVLSSGGSSVIATFLAFALVGAVRAGRIVNA